MNQLLHILPQYIISTALLLPSLAWCTLASTAPTTLTPEAMAQLPQWKALLHYRRSTPLVYESEIDDPKFFLSKNGKHSLTEELAATLSAIQSSPDIKCRFPARYHWLATRMQWADKDSFIAECTALQQWLEAISPGKVTLIFPAAYMNSPSSMFGHLFLRLDAPNQKNDLLAFSVNFGANVDESDSALSYTIKGLIGGYPGTVSVLPYYEKVKEYSDIESRDIWEYPLNLSTEESRFIMLHVWELKDAWFDYYFIDENCAYRILSLIEVARPQLDLMRHFAAKAIPADIVKAIVKSGITAEEVYRPALASILNHQISQLNTEEKSWLDQIDRDPGSLHKSGFLSLAPLSRAAILETATELLRFRLSANASRAQHKEKGHLLLTERSKIDTPSPFPAIAPPAISHDQGHDTLFLQASTLERNGQQYFTLAARPAYHSITDPLAGYIPGAQIKFSELEISFNDARESRIEQFTLLNIVSLAPRNGFIEPISWTFDLSTQRKSLSSNETTMIAQTSAAAGVSFGVPDNQVYLLGGARIVSRSGQQRSGTLQAGIHAGWLFNKQHEQQSWLQMHWYHDAIGDQAGALGIAYSHTFNLQKNHALNITLERMSFNNHYTSDLRINYRYFL